MDICVNLSLSELDPHLPTNVVREPQPNQPEEHRPDRLTPHDSGHNLIMASNPTFAQHLFGTDLRWVEGSVVQFDVFERLNSDADDDEVNMLVPFQIAYAVSIHKAQGVGQKQEVRNVAPCALVKLRLACRTQRTTAAPVPTSTRTERGRPFSVADQNLPA
ncbi:hypothetical protein [Amycolatopsis sp. NPDC049868]|uniref:hypothetical protein n=1 Tax=Amycolatopsis sp. NPDC049868 TaxID=3363934 RepID=UPI00379A31CE